MNIEHTTQPAAGATPGAPAASSLARHLQALSAGPLSLPVRELIDRYMARYAGADSTRAQRLAAWST